MTDFAFKLQRKNAEVPDIYFTLLDAADNTSRSILNQNAREQDRGNWVLFRI